MWKGTILNICASLTDIVIPFIIQAYLNWIIEESPPFYTGLLLGSLISILFVFRVYCYRYSALINYDAVVRMYCLMPAVIM